MLVSAMFAVPTEQPSSLALGVVRARGCPAGGQEGLAGVEVGTGTKPCGRLGEAGSWPGLCGLWLSGPQCWAQGEDLDRTLQGKESHGFNGFTFHGCW